MIEPDDVEHLFYKQAGNPPRGKRPKIELPRLFESELLCVDGGEPIRFGGLFESNDMATIRIVLV